MRPLVASAALVAAAASLGPGLGSAEPVARAYVLDSGAHTLVALELPSGRRVGSLALAGTPGALVQSPDGRHLVVLDRGPGEGKDGTRSRAGWPSGPTVPSLTRSTPRRRT